VREEHSWNYEDGVKTSSPVRARRCQPSPRWLIVSLRAETVSGAKGGWDEASCSCRGPLRTRVRGPKGAYRGAARGRCEILTRFSGMCRKIPVCRVRSAS
jgi:hypothetical protein